MSAVTGGQLNRMSDKQRREALNGPFGLQMLRWAGDHVTVVRWAEQTASGVEMRNGSIFFLDFGSALFAVTAGHVYARFLEAKQAQPGTIGYIENLAYDFEQRLAGLGEPNDGGPDIATFEMSRDELDSVGKSAITGPSLHPFHYQSALLAGFPAASNVRTSLTTISFGLHAAGLRVNSVADQQITFPFERDQWIDNLGHGLPPQGFDFGGMSGGPMLLPIDRRGKWELRLGGVIKEFSRSAFKTVETIICVSAHHIQSDGSINPNSAPIHHAVPASG